MLLSLLHLLIVYLLFWLTGFFFFSVFFRRKIDLITAVLPVQVLFPLMGYLILIHILLFASVLSPISSKAMTLILAHLAGVSLIRWKLLRTIYRNTTRPTRLQWFVFLPLFLFLLVAAGQQADLPDMWGYHVQSIRWIHEYPAIPGLGNLCPKFAFNHVSFLPAALFSFPILSDQPVYSINLFLCLLVLLQFTRAISLQPTRLKSGLLLLLLMAFLHYFKPAIPTTSVDLSAASLVLLMGLLLLERLSSKPSNILIYTVLILLLAIVIPLTKLSYLPLLLMVFFVVKRKEPASWVLPFILLIVYFIPWFSRNYILSGYLVYPFPMIDWFQVDWKVPVGQAWDDYHWIRSWARVPFVDHREVLSLPFSGWFFPWVRQLGWFTWFFLAAGLLALIAGLAKKQYFSRYGEGWRLLLLLNTLVLVSWFILAPSPRFVIASILLFAFIPLYWLAGKQDLAGLARWPVAMQALSMTLLFLVLESFILHPFHKPAILKPLPFPEVEMKVEKVQWLEIKLPAQGVNCCLSPLPCAPKLLPGLSTRGTSLLEGFKIINMENTQIPAHE